jgi:multiple sugar transport system substrate-binding protein
MSGQPGKITRRSLIGAVGAVCIAGVLTACGQSTAQPPTSAPAPQSGTSPPSPTPAAPATPTVAPAQQAAPVGQKVELNYQSREPETPAGKQLMWPIYYAQFQKQYPNITVKFLPTPTQLYQQTVSSMVAGTAADIIEMCCADSTDFVQKQRTLDLQPYIQQDAKELNMADYFPHQFDPWKDEKGDIHLFPRFTGTQGLFYNIDMFNAKQVPLLSETWDKNIDFNKYAEIASHFVQTKGLQTWGTSSYGIGANWLTQYFLRGYGTHMVDPNDHNKTLLGTKEAQDCLEMLRKWIWDDHIYAQGNEMGGQGVLALFLAGRLAMMEMGTWNLFPVLQGAKFKWDVAPFPSGPASSTTHQSVDGSFIWSGTKYKEQSWTLLKGTASVDFGRLLIQYDAKQPSRKSLAPEFATLLRQSTPNLQDIKLEIFPQSIEKNIGGPEEMFNNDNTAKTTILQPAFDKVYTLGNTPVSVIGKAGDIVDKFNAGKIGIQDIGNELKAIGVS